MLAPYRFFFLGYDLSISLSSLSYRAPASQSYTILTPDNSVNVFAIWRLATIVQHKAATWPVRDPTWYAPISILLAVLEVDCASICASVPVFWPVLRRQIGNIFVTKEIQITHEDRYEFAGYGNDSWSRTELRSDLKPVASRGVGMNYKEIHFASEVFSASRAAGGDSKRLPSADSQARSGTGTASGDGSTNTSWFHA